MILRAGQFFREACCKTCSRFSAKALSLRALHFSMTESIIFRSPFEDERVVVEEGWFAEPDAVQGLVFQPYGRMAFVRAHFLVQDVLDVIRPISPVLKGLFQGIEERGGPIDSGPLRPEALPHLF